MQFTKSHPIIAGISTSVFIILIVFLSTLVTFDFEKEAEAQFFGRTGVITVITCTDADTQYSYPIPNTAMGIQYVADGGTIRYAYEEGVLDGAPSATDAYMELTDDQSDGDLNIRFRDVTMYFAAPVGGTRVRIKVFKY